MCQFVVAYMRCKTTTSSGETLYIAPLKGALSCGVQLGDNGEFHLLASNRVWTDSLLDIRSVFNTVEEIQTQHQTCTRHLSIHAYSEFFYISIDTA